MPDLEEQAEAFQSETDDALRQIILNGDSDQRALAHRIRAERLRENLRESVRIFAAGSQKFADLANDLQTVIDSVRVNPVGDALTTLSGLLGQANRVFQAIRDPESLPPISDDGLAITFTLPGRSDEEESPPAPPATPATDVPQLPPKNSRKFAELQVEYQQLFEHATIPPNARARVEGMAQKLIGLRGRYEAVGGPLGIPWHFIACIHLMEGDCNFTTHLHNGDPLSARTTRVPAGRPESGGPPFTWEESARDALTMKKYSGLQDWSLPRTLFRWEGYNGFGYRPKQVPTPYLWSFTSVYSKGKYVADGRFDADAVSQQIGCAAVLKALVAAGAATI